MMRLTLSRLKALFDKGEAKTGEFVIGAIVCDPYIEALVFTAIKLGVFMRWLGRRLRPQARCSDLLLADVAADPCGTFAGFGP